MDPAAGRRLLLLPGRFAVCRLPARTPLEAIGEGPFFSVTRTSDELSIVCREDRAPDSARVEAGWRLLRVAGKLDFSAVGILAGLTAALAAADVSVFVLSTFDTDYLLVRRESLSRARAALEANGWRVVDRETGSGNEG